MRETFLLLLSLHGNGRLPFATGRLTGDQDRDTIADRIYPPAPGAADRGAFIVVQGAMAHRAGEQGEHGIGQGAWSGWIGRHCFYSRQGDSIVGQAEKRMLRVGLTGGLGSGKSAVALVWAEAGVPVLEADAIGRALMQPGQAVHGAIAAAFGPGVVAENGQFDRAALAREAFAGGRLAELNAIVHPAVIAAQDAELDRLAAEGQTLLAVVESALIFEVSEDEAAGATASQQPLAKSWRDRFDRLVLVAASEPLRIDRFVHRVAGANVAAPEKTRLQEDARRRIAAQLPDAYKRQYCDYVIENDRTLVLLRREALSVLAALRKEAATKALPAGH